MSVTAPNGAATLAVGEQVGSWTIVDFLGSGGSASVYLATPSSMPDRPPTSLGDPRDVALRICRPSDERHLQAIVSTYEATPVHKNVAAIHDVRIETINGHHHVVCIAELADGGTLAEQIERAPLDVAQSRVLSEHLLDGLAAYHQLGLVHGDVKPGNVMRFGSTWKLVDPAATEVTVADPNTSAVVSHERTLRYVPPEMLDVPGRTRRTGDVWALGVTLHEAASGESPFGSMSDQVVARSSIARSVPADLAKLIRACIAPIEQRPRTADELRHLPSSSPLRSRRVVAIAVAGLLIAALAVAAVVRVVVGTDGATEPDLAVGSDATVPSSPVGSTSSTSSPAEPTLPAATEDSVPAPTPSTAPPSSDSTGATGSTDSTGSTAPPSTASGGDSFTFDVEGDGDLARFVMVDGAESLSAVAANGGTVLEVAANNVSRRIGLLATPGGSPIRGGSSVAMRADIRLAYYGSTEWGALGPAYGLVLKTLPDGGGAYVATVFPNNEGITMRVGLIADPVRGAGFETYEYATLQQGHSPLGEQLLFAQPFDFRPVVTELGYWSFEAELVVRSAAVEITASLVSPAGERQSLVWVDDGAEAFTGDGAVGLAAYGLWSIENRYDNVVVSVR